MNPLYLIRCLSHLLEGYTSVLAAGLPKNGAVLPVRSCALSLPFAAQNPFIMPRSGSFPFRVVWGEPLVLFTWVLEDAPWPVDVMAFIFERDCVLLIFDDSPPPGREFAGFKPHAAHRQDLEPVV
jgi:hypothetical protein